LKKSEIKLIEIEIIIILALVLNVFVINIINEYLISLIFTIFSGLIIFLLGYEKEKNPYKKNLLLFITFYTFGYIIILYGIGLLTGFVLSPYNNNFINLIKNIVPLILVILTSEFLRYLFCKKGNKRKLILILSVILFVLVDISLALYFYDLSDKSEIMKLLTLVLLPSILKNITLTDFAYKYGFSQNILYRLIIELYSYIIPIIPDFSIYLEAITLLVLPVILRFFINNRFEQKEKKDIREKNKFQKIISILLIVLILIIVGLNSNLFRFWIAVVGSGSMEPTIEIGDLILVDKSYQKELSKLKVDDILVFKENNKIYTHRIIDIEVNGEDYSISTKGDRKGNTIDDWIVENENVIGVVKLKIKYLGYPSLWIKEILEER